MKRSEIERAPERGALAFTLEGENGEWRVTVPREMLDELLGDAATHEERLQWAEENSDALKQAAGARISGGSHDKQFERLRVEALR